MSLRLAVNAGALQEEADQRGLAHFIEHMAFNGTQNFKPGELVTFLESIGARFGPHVNASTSFDETIYMLDVPTDRDGYVDKGLLALHDFAVRRARCCRKRWRRNAASCSRNGAAVWAPARASPTSSCRSCCRARAMPSGCRLARPR